MQEMTMTQSPKMSLEEMAEIVDQAREAAFLDQEYRQREWAEEQRAKAPEILDLLRRHLPTETQQEVEGYLSSPYGSDCLCELLQSLQPRSL
jgi:ABC-type dipeptide/oligopeptide/nickel transport system ATPase component